MQIKVKKSTVKMKEKYRKEERKVPKARRERNCEEMREGELQGRRSVIKR